MSGFVRNDWGQYLNGGSSHYNFEYRSPQPAHLLNLIPTPTLAPPPMPITSPQNTSHSRKNIKDGKMLIPTHKGGKRKSLRSRHSRHSRHSRRNHKRSNKKYRRTHRK